MDITQWKRAVCHVVEHAEGGAVGAGLAAGTGYLVAADLVATCDHVVARTPTGGRVWLQFIDGPSLWATVRWRDQAADAAIVELDAPVAVEPLPVGASYHGHDTWESYGFPATGQGDPLPFRGDVRDPSYRAAWGELAARSCCSTGSTRSRTRRSASACSCSSTACASDGPRRGS